MVHTQHRVEFPLTFTTQVNLFPKYISIRRGVIFATITAGWVMVPWKIVTSAASLLTFMAGLAIFLAPISAITATDYWLVKKRHVDVPSLYRRHARYRYRHGVNWRAAAAFLVSVTPNVPGLANAVNPNVRIGAGIRHLYNMNYLWGLVSAGLVYWALSRWFPARETLLEASILYDPGMVVGGGAEEEAGLGRPDSFGSSGKDRVEVSAESAGSEKRGVENV